MPTSRLAAIVLAAAVLLAAAWMLLRPDPPPRSKGQPAWRVEAEIRAFEKTLPAPKPAPAGLVPRYILPPGTGLSYRFQAESGVAVTFEDDSQGGGPLTYAWSGTLGFRSYEASPAGFSLGCRLDDLALEMSGQGSNPARVDPIAGEAARETLLECDPRGRIQAIWFPKGMGPEARNLVKGAILATLLALPKGDETTWEEVEEDGTGRFIARYAIEGVHAAAETTLARVRRTRGDWIEVAGGPQGRANAEGSSTGLFDVTQGHWHAIEADEKVHLEHGSVRVDGSLRAKVLLLSRDHDAEAASQGAARAAALREGADRSGPGGAEGAEEIARRIEEDEWRKALDGVTADALLVDLMRLFASGAGEGDEAHAAVEKLVALLRIDPSAAVAVAAWLRRGAQGEAAFAVLSALGTAGPTEAQAVLVEVLSSDTHPEDVRTSATLCLSFGRSPTAASEEALTRIATTGRTDALTGTAAVGLGIMANRLAATDAARSSALAVRLTDLAGKASDATGKRMAADALGNAGRPEVADAVLRLSEDPDVGVRVAAAFSLRFLEGEHVDRRLDALLRDAQPDVRASAAQALGYRAGAEPLRLLDLAASDADPQVRDVALASLARRIDDPVVRERVRRMSVEDPSPDLRLRAAELLNGQ